MPDWKQPALLGYLVILLTFGVLGTWSAFARFDSSVIAPGVVTPATNVKTVQHFEGGIIQKIFVHEGQHVVKNQILFTLDPTQARANAGIVHDQLLGNLAQEARLVAERDGTAKITFPPQIMKEADRSTVRQMISDQEKQFTERRAALNGQVSILQNRIQQFGTEIQGLLDEKQATTRQLGLINQELTDLRDLLAKNLVQKSRVLSLEREKARLEGVIGRSIADKAKAEDSISEAKLRIDQLRKKFAEEVNGNILNVRQKVADLQQKLGVAKDVLRRIDIRAPRSGYVQDVKVSTIGAVIRPGEPLLEIVPDHEALVINARVSPLDIDVVHVGMQAQVRFSSFHSVSLPIIMGRVITVSHDQLTDPRAKASYYLARVVVDQAHVPAIIHGQIMPGMPAEVLIPTGARSVLSYLMRPLRNRASKAMREQ